jgi:hypothetical protein
MSVMNDLFNPERLRMPTAVLAVPAGERARKRAQLKRGEKFLKGPVPWTWLSRAGQLPGKALHVGIALWHLAGLNRSGRLALSGSLLRQMGVKRVASYRALTALEQAGLVSVERCVGRQPIVTIRDNRP